MILKQTSRASHSQQDYHFRIRGRSSWFLAFLVAKWWISWSYREIKKGEVHITK